MKRKQTFALVASAMLTVLAGLTTACSKMDDPVLSQDDTMETVGFAEAHPLYEARMGDVVDTDGNAYTVTEDQLLPWSVTPAGVIVDRYYNQYYNRYEAIILALDDEPNEMDWETAKGPNGAAAHTPAIAGLEWILPSAGDWRRITYYNGYNHWDFPPSLNKYIEKAGGTPLDGNYWSDTEYSAGYASNAYSYDIDPSPNGQCRERYPSTERIEKVRACIESDLRANIRSDQFVLSKKSLSFTAFTHTHSFTVSRPGNGKVTATSSNTDVAKVTVSNATGSTATVKVTVVADGTATITVKSDQTLYHKAYTNNDKTVSVTASGIKFERTTLAELKSFIKSLGNHDIPYDYLGRYVTSTGELSRSPEGAIGIVAFYTHSDYDCEEGIPGNQNILVLSVNDVSTGAAWWKCTEDILLKESYGIASKNWSANGYTNTKKLHENYLGGSFAEAANLCWNMGVAIKGEPTTQWFLPSYRQWEDIMMSIKGIGRGENRRDETGMSTNSFYWSSTECDSYLCADALGTDGKPYWCIKYYDNVHVRAVFAY